MRNPGRGFGRSRDRLVYCTIYRVQGSIYTHIMAHYRFLPHHLSTIHHGNQGRIANPRLAGDIKITVCERNTIYSVLVLLFVRPLKRGELLQQACNMESFLCRQLVRREAFQELIRLGARKTPDYQVGAHMRYWNGRPGATLYKTSKIRGNR